MTTSKRLRANKPKRGRKRTAGFDQEAARRDRQPSCSDADALDELRLVQERRDLAARAARWASAVDLTALEAAFVKVAKSYSERKRHLLRVVA